ncbi:MAG: hypothetical protein DRG78_08090 [Epsilonproteobacteria bacterium]|nr:MAG: hypothetical protein DRG78_08090 [Campylobacterota bacterium]
MLTKSIKRVDYINYFILIYAFILSFPVALKTPIIVLLIIFWLTDKNRFNSNFIKMNHIFLMMGIFLFYIIISSIWSEANAKEILVSIKKYWYYLPMFIIYKYIKKEYILYTISSFLVGMFISELLSYGVIFSFWEIRHATAANPSIFLHHIQYSIFLSLTSIILFFKAIYETKRNVQILYFLFFITVTLNLFLNVGRTGYITFLVSIFLSLIVVYKLKKQIIITTFIALVSIITLAYNFSPNFKIRTYQGIEDIQQLTQEGKYNTSIGSRFALWIVAKEIFIKNPILGVGVANHIHTKNEFAKMMFNNNFKFLLNIKHFHNSFLEILTQFGIIGLSIFLYILYLLFKIPIKDKKIKIFKISILSIFILGSFTDRLFYINSTISLFALIFGLILAQYKIEEESNALQ